MKDIINEKVKHRQWFRPFAPSILRSKTVDWFENDIENGKNAFQRYFCCLEWCMWKIAFGQYKFSEHGYRVYHQEQLQLQQMQLQLKSLQQQRERLAKQILELRHNPKALEDLVHRELGYVYPDELMMIMPDEHMQQHKNTNKAMQK